MLNVTPGLAAHLNNRFTTLATCWRILRADGEEFGFTSHDVDIEFEGLIYRADTGILPSALTTRSKLEVDNVECQGFLNSEAITESDLKAGVWDFAQVWIFQVNWANLSHGKLRLRRGWFGEVGTKDGRFVVESSGLTSALNKTIGELVTPHCAALLGDARCKVDLTPYTATGEVLSVTSNRVFDTDLTGAVVALSPGVTGNPDVDYFAEGKLTWLTGLNAGLSEDVRGYALTGVLSLQLPMTRTVQVGDTFSVYAGCSKSRDGVRGCIERFNNILNFRGFPDLPGLDKILRVGGQ